MPSTAFDAALACIRRKAEAAGPSPSDRELLDRFTTTSDQAAFAALVRRHGGRVLATCQQVLADPADVDDAFQATFLVLLDKARAIRWQPSLGGWLTAVAHRVSVRARDAARRRKRHEDKFAGAASEAAVGTDPSWRDACGVLHEELDRLPDRYRLPLVVCYLEGKSRDEAAAQLGWSVGSVKGRLERGRDWLRRRLIRRGIDLSAGLLAALAGETSSAAAIPTALVRATVEAAGGVPSAAVAALVRGAGAITYAKSIAVAVVFGLAAAGSGVGLLAMAEAPPADPPLAPIALISGVPAVPVDEIIVHGRVLDPAGKPMPGARLFTFQMPAGTPPGKSPSDVQLDLNQRAVTDADGQFRFTAPRVAIHPPGDQSYLMPVYAVADGFGLAWAKVVRPDESVTLRLSGDQPIVGRVLDSEGRPVTGAAVQVREVIHYRSGRLDGFLAGWRANWQDAMYADLETGWSQPPESMVRVIGPDRDGHFRVNGVGAERMVILDVQGPGLAQGVLLVMTRAGFDPDPINRAVSAQTPFALRSRGQPPLLYGPTLTYVATPAKPLAGTVREAGSGRPVANASVTTGIAYSTNVSATTDIAGRYHLDGISKQKDYSIFIRPPADSPLVGRSVTVADTEGLQPLTADVELTRGVVIAGKVTDRATGGGVSCDVHFYLLPDDASAGKPRIGRGRPSEFGATTDATGRFRFPVISGPGVLTVRAHGREMLDMETIAPFLPAQLDEQERKRTRVKPHGDAGYLVSTADGSSRPITANVIKWLNPAEGAEAEHLELFVERGRTATVRIEDPHGQPVTGVIVSGMTAMWPITFALSRSECTLYALEPGKPRTVVFYHADKKFVGSLRIRGDETAPLTVRLLPAGGAVTGRLLDTDGRPVAGAGVAQYYPDDESASELFRYLASRGGPGIRTKTDADGRFRFEEVLPDLNLLLGFEKGATILAGPKSNQWFGPHRASAGKTLDLGDIPTRPWEP